MVRCCPERSPQKDTGKTASPWVGNKQTHSGARAVESPKLQDGQRRQRRPPEYTDVSGYTRISGS